MRGRPVEADNDPNDESKIPKYANDLREPDISLDLRKKRLDQAQSSKKKLKSWEIDLVLTSRDSSAPDTKYLEARKNLRLIRDRIDRRNLTVPCELKSCSMGSPNVSIYKNICDACLFEKFNLNGSNIEIDNARRDSVLYDLMTLRNLITRLSFLESELSSSLSNQLSRDELINAVNEIDAIDKII